MIMIYGASSRYPSDNWNALLPDKLNIYFSKCILMLTYNDAGIIYPKHDHIFLEVLEDIFLGGDVKVRISAISLNADHDLFNIPANL